MARPSEIKAFLMERRRSSLGEIAVHFDTTSENARALLEPWLAKNKVHRVQPETACAGSCGRACCNGGLAAEVYEWKEELD